MVMCTTGFSKVRKECQSCRNKCTCIGISSATKTLYALCARGFEATCFTHCVCMEWVADSSSSLLK
eukprot:2173058-Heterocapsa_arctica.AAC.1